MSPYIYFTVHSNEVLAGSTFEWGGGCMPAVGISCNQKQRKRHAAITTLLLFDSVGPTPAPLEGEGCGTFLVPALGFGA